MMQPFTLSVSFITLLTLTACSDTMESDYSDVPMATNDSELKADNNIVSKHGLSTAATEVNIDQYRQDPMIKNVNHYAKWIAQDLFANIDFPSNQDVFVISDFALLDSDLSKTNHFGRQLTEALMHEVNRTGFSVIDTKATGFMRITEQGDVFFHSKDYTELSEKIPATNIIAGTLTRHQGGYLINARIISMETMAMVSSAQAFVPYDVVEAVLKESLEKTPPELDKAENKEDEELPNELGIPVKAYKKKSS